MFTGLIQQVGHVLRLEAGPEGGRLIVGGTGWAPAPVLGESMAVNGVCLTVAAITGGAVAFDVLRETLEKTCLRDKAAGAPVNLERALRVGDAMGGHFVTGHVDGTGTVTDLQAIGRDWRLRVACDAAVARGVVRKGSIAIDGVSLTVTEVEDAALEVHLIPTTRRATALSLLREGDRVNLETDLIGKYVARRLQENARGDGSGLTAERLREAGFG